MGSEIGFLKKNVLTHTSGKIEPKQMKHVNVILNSIFVIHLLWKGVIQCPPPFPFPFPTRWSIVNVAFKVPIPVVGQLSIKPDFFSMKSTSNYVLNQSGKLAFYLPWNSELDWVFFATFTVNADSSTVFVENRAAPEDVGRGRCPPPPPPPSSSSSSSTCASITRTLTAGGHAPPTPSALLAFCARLRGFAHVQRGKSLLVLGRLRGDF